MGNHQTASHRRRALGARGEDATAARYEADGYEVLDRNWRCRDGELDLIVTRGGVVVFCEVKTRSSDRFGAPVEAVTRDKRRRIRRLAARWLGEHPHTARELRFDVASVMLRNGRLELDLIEAAF